MHRLTLLVVTVATALLAGAGTATGGSSVDPGTLTPEPPPGASCQQDGLWVICETTFDASHPLEPAFDLPCGTVYESLTDVRAGIRWYADGKLVKRFVSQEGDGFWTLSPSGTGPIATVTLRANWRDEYAVPGDESTASTTVHGNDIAVSANGYGVIAHIAGQDEPDGTHHGAVRFVDDPTVAERLCEALG